MRFWRLLAALLLLLLPSCSSCGEDSAPGAGSGDASADLAPVTEPEGLMAELWITDPDALWRRLRKDLGSEAALLPASFPMLAATLLDLPASAAGLFDAKVPALGAVVSLPSAAPAWLLGLHVKSGRELAAALTNGADATHTLRSDHASGVVFLESKARRASKPRALGIVGNYLLVAEGMEALAVAGPFVARSLPQRPAPAEPAVLTARQRALAGPIATELRKLWREYAVELKALDQKNRQQHGGRTPDFGDPLAALNGIAASVDGLVEVLESARELRVVLEPLEDGIELYAELTPQADGPAAVAVRELAVGDVQPLLALPNHTLLGVLSRTSASQREASANSMQKRLRELFGERLSEQDEALIEDTLTQLARGRGDFAAYGLVERAGDLHAVMRGAAGDANAFNAGLKSLLKFARVRAFSEPLRQFIGELSVRPSSVSIPGVPGRVERATLTLKPARMQLAGAAPGKLEAETFELLWKADERLVHAAAGRDAAPSLRELLQAPAENTLAGDPAVSAAARRAGPVSFAVVLRPLVLSASDPAVDPRAPLFIGLGRHGGGMRVRVIAAGAAVRGILRGAAEP